MRLLVLPAILFCLLTSTAAAQPRLLFDQGHRQPFRIENDGPLQLQDLATLFRQSGWQVESSSDRLTADRLSGIDALVISGLFTPLDREEIGNVLDYLQKGGKLTVMLHIGTPAANLLQALGIQIGNLPINDSRTSRTGTRSISPWLR